MVLADSDESREDSFEAIARVLILLRHVLFGFVLFHFACNAIFCHFVMPRHGIILFDEARNTPGHPEPT